MTETKMTKRHLVMVLTEPTEGQASDLSSLNR